MSSYLKGVNQTKVTADLLLQVVQMHTAMAPEDRGVFEARAFGIFELLKSKGFRIRKIASVGTAINFD